METAFVMIKCDAGNENSVISNSRQIVGVKDAFGTFGTYDVIVILHSESQKNLEDIISKQIRNLEHVRGTYTLFTDSPKEGFVKALSVQEKEILDIHTAQAYVMIEHEQMKQQDIISHLQEIPEIIEGFVIIGSYDLIVKITAPSYNDVSNVVTKKIRTISGIKKTLTLHIIMEQGAIQKIAV